MWRSSCYTKPYVWSFGAWCSSTCYGGGRGAWLTADSPFLSRGYLIRPNSSFRRCHNAVGNGRTLNTEVFERAVEAMAELGKRGGRQLDVQEGVRLTAPFNLENLVTLFLSDGAVILAVEHMLSFLVPTPSVGSPSNNTVIRSSTEVEY